MQALSADEIEELKSEIVSEVVAKIAGEVGNKSTAYSRALLESLAVQHILTFFFCMGMHIRMVRSLLTSWSPRCVTYKPHEAALFFS